MLPVGTKLVRRGGNPEDPWSKITVVGSYALEHGLSELVVACSETFSERVTVDPSGLSEYDVVSTGVNPPFGALAVPR